MVVGILGIFLFFFLGFERHAFAWGTGAHIDFGLQILSNAALLAPAIRHLLKKNPKSYLYGNLAADTVIGKNLAKNADEHVHNWEVALRLLDRATDDADRAFIYGYLSHLAADTVAHNYFVPKKRVDGYRSVTSGHAYWELRYDSFLPGSVWAASRDLGKERFPKHDELLDDGIKATILNVKANRFVWDGVVGLTRIDRWRDLMRAHAEKSTTPFAEDERREFRDLAIGAVLAFLNDERDSKTYVADPTGMSNLDACWKIGALLRKGTSKGSMGEGEADDIARDVGAKLRDSLHRRREADLKPVLVAAGA